MSDISANNEALRNDRAAALVLPVTAGTLFVSAFLLFSVQPFFAKMVLPRLGGSPAVWSVAMVFFQSMLLAGYGYAHFLTSRLSLRLSVIIHICLLAAATLALPIAIPDGWGRAPADGQSFWLIGLFLVSVGLPFFAVSANGPLLQAWFAKTGHPHASDPYFLYGASNIGSFASLILYVVLIEPLTNLGQQGTLWTIGFLVLAGLIAACGFLTTGLQQSAAPVSSAAQADSNVSIPSSQIWRERIAWTAYAFLPSALLVAVTAQVSTDVAAVPFLWIVPLALFLLTFVIVFQKQPLIGQRMAERLAPWLVVPLLYTTLHPLRLPMAFEIGFHFTTFFVLALCSHGALAARRPASSRLTEFYFAMSIGGVLGGVFSSLAAVQLFSWVAEYPLLLIAALVLVPALCGSSPKRHILISVGAGLLFSACLAAVDVIGLFSTISSLGSLLLINAALCLAAIYFIFRSPAAVIMLCCALFANTALFNSYFLVAHTERSFFGVLRVIDSPDIGVRRFQHGTTLHGAIRIADVTGAPGRPLPLTYYTSDGGIALAIEAARKNLGGKIAQAGIIGVGAGSLACQFQLGEKLDFFEIDPAVVRIAQDPSRFTFLSECGQDTQMIIGDGRIELSQVPAARYDVLVVDAFSSDSIPVHLMTREAIELYMQRLKPSGLVVLHISNNHLELKSVVGAIGKSLGLSVRSALFTPKNTPETLDMAVPSTVAVLARSDAALGTILDDARWQPVNAGATAPWTDGYSNLLAAMWRANFKQGKP
jgi:hypothetical protein